MSRRRRREGGRGGRAGGRRAADERAAKKVIAAQGKFPQLEARLCYVHLYVQDVPMFRFRKFYDDNKLIPEVPQLS